MADGVEPVSGQSATAAQAPTGAKLWKGAAWVVLGRGLGIFATLLVTLAAPRWLEPSQYAAFALVSSVMIFASCLALFGLNGAMVRFLAERLGNNDLDGARRTLRVGMRLVLASALVAAALTAVYLSLGGMRLFGLPLDPVVILLVCVGLGLLALQQLAAESLRGFHDLRMASILSGGQLGGPVTNLLFLAGLFVAAKLLHGDKLTLRMTLSLLVAALMISAPLSLLSLRHISRRILAGASASSSAMTDREELNRLVPVCWPLMVMAALSFAATQADLWLAGALCASDKDGVALYAVARRLVVMVAMPLQMVNLTVMATVPALFFQGKKAQLQRLLRLAALVAAGPSGLCLLTMLLFPHFVLGVLFKPFYQDAAGYLMILTLGQLALVVAGSCALTLSMTGYQHVALRISLLSASVLAVVGTLATHFFGLRGLAIAAVGATMTECGLQWFFTRRLVGVWTHFSPLAAIELAREWWRQRERKPAAEAAIDAVAPSTEMASEGVAAAPIALAVESIAYPAPQATKSAPVHVRSPMSAVPSPTAIGAETIAIRPATSLWWLHPSWVFALLNGLTMLAALALSDAAFRLYGTPKYFDFDYFLLGLCGIAAFVGGQWLAKATGHARPAVSGLQQLRLRPWFYGAIILSIVGYTVWFGGGFLRAHSLAPLKEIFSVHDDFESDVRKEIFPTTPGVTTLTQFGMAAITLGLLLPATTGAAKRRQRWLLVALLGLAVLRMLLVSERLALIELAVPAVVVGVRMTVLARDRLSPRTLRRLQLAPALAIVAVTMLFGGAEYFRSWRYYTDRFDSFPEFALWRMSGYYTTAHNNGAMAMKMHGASSMPYYVFEQFWRFPLVVKSDLSYSSTAGGDASADDAPHMSLLDRWGTPELNNEGGLFAPAMDFGWPGYLVYWLAFGYFAGRLHRGFLAGSLAGLLFYPLMLIGILESPLILYLSSVRSFPSLVLLAMIVGWEFCRRVSPREARAAAATAPPLHGAGPVMPIGQVISPLAQPLGAAT